MALVYVGVDFETSDNNLIYWDKAGVLQDGGARAIQIGVSFDVDHTFSSGIGWGALDLVWNERSETIHGIEWDRVVRGEFPKAPIVDEKLFNWVIEMCGDRDPTTSRFLVPVGWNVGQYDMPFMRQALPRCYPLFSRRTVDLNAVVYSMDKCFEIGGSYVSYTGLKRMSKRYATEVLVESGYGDNPHDAGWDAQMSLLCFNFLRMVQMGKAPDMSKPEDTEWQEPTDEEFSEEINEVLDDTGAQLATA